MRTKHRILAAALLLAAFIACLAVPASAQVSPTRLQRSLTNAFDLGGASSTNVSALGAPIELRQGRGLALSAIYRGASSIYTTGQVALIYGVSVDGTNYSTHPHGVWHWITPNGSTAVYGYTNIPAAVLDNARWAKLIQVTNANTATNMSAILTNVVASTGG